MAEPITNVLGTVAIKHCGAYDATVHYEKLNVVTYQGSSYCAKTNAHNVLPTNSDYWDLIASKGDQGDKGDTGDTGPAPVRGTDYWTQSDIENIEATMHDDVYQEVSTQVGELTSATPLAASSTSGMTDTTRIYVNTTNGHWYWYDGDSWEDGGVYQATGLSLDDPVLEGIIDNLYEMPIIYENGAYDISTGNKSTHNRRARTSDYVKFKSNIVHFNVSDDYGLIIFEYDSTKTFIDYYGAEYGYGSFDLNVDKTHYYTWMLRDADNSTYENIDLSNVKVYEYLTQYVNENLGVYEYQTGSDLITSENNMINGGYIPIYKQYIEKGTILNDGTESANATRYRTKGYIDLSQYETIKIVNSSTSGTQYVCFYDENQDFTRQIALTSGNNIIELDNDKTYARLLYGGAVSTRIILVNDLNVYGIAKQSFATKEYVDSKIIDVNKIDQDYDEMADSVSDTVIGLQNKKTLSFAFITDLHYNFNKDTDTYMYKQIYNSVKKLANNTNLMFVAFGGDNTDNLYPSNLNMQKELTKDVRYLMKKDLSIPLYICKGNHDDNSIRDASYNGLPLSKDNQEHIPTKTIYDYELYDYYTKFNENSSNIVMGEDGYSYFYVDYPDQRIRVFILNSIDIPYTLNSHGALDYTGQWTYAYRNEQLNFVANALKFSDKVDPNEWTAVFIKHHSVNPQYFTDGIMHNNDILVNIINAYQNGTSYIASGGSAPWNYNINVNYTGQVGKVIDIAGHWHSSHNGVYSGIPYVVCPCARYTARQNDDLPTCFDIVTINTETRKAHFTRFGQGFNIFNREISY